MGTLVETSVCSQVDVSQNKILFLHCPAQSEPKNSLRLFNNGKGWKRVRNSKKGNDYI